MDGSMPLISEIVEFLDRIGEAPSRSAEVCEGRVSAVATDRQAGSADLAWLSPRNAAAEPERAEAFEGALLICPRTCGTRFVSGTGSRVAVARPKRAFVRVLEQFFAESTETRWPAAGEAPIAADALIAPDACLSAGVTIASGVTIGAGSRIGPNTCIANCTIGANVSIGANCSIGQAGYGYERDEDGALLHFPHVGRVVIDDDVDIGANTCIDRGAIGDTVIGRGAKIDNLVHIAHNVQVGAHSMLIANTMIGGSVVIGERAWVAPSACIKNQVTIESDAVIGLGAVVLRDVAPGEVVVGNPARILESRSGA
jgi:UDP-3-O-[3-hydroxymyristoyl] glucosamine N-acyltransferase